VGGGGTVAHVQRALQRHGGRVGPHGPVDLWAAFEDAPAALGAARAAREAVSSESLAIAVHSGPADVSAGGGRAAALELTAVVLDAANPGQTLVTAAARETAGPAVGNVVDLGLYQLAELIEPVRLFAVVDDRAADAVVFLLERSHVVTLTGVGGIGKRQLAVEIAERIGPEVRDGVWLALWRRAPHGPT
jgi:class 3 adenylate cyclase